MERIVLNVPFSQKDEAKSLGARWDPGQKTWYVPQSVDASHFARWLPIEEPVDAHQGPAFYVRAPYYYIIDSESRCWNCSHTTRVHAFALPEEHEEFEFFEDDDAPITGGGGEWIQAQYRGTASNVDALAPSCPEPNASLYRPIQARLQQDCWW